MISRHTRTIRTEQHGQAGEWAIVRRNRRHPIGLTYVRMRQLHVSRWIRPARRATI